MQSKKQDIERKLNELNTQKNNLDESIENLNSQISNLEERLSNSRHQLASYKSKLNFLKDLKRRLEGYSKGVKILLTYKNEQKLPFRGLRDSLANLINVKQGYEIPIELSLGQYAQNIIIDDSRQVEEAIMFLKNNELGWVNFLPLSNFKGMHVDIDEDLASKTNGPLKDFVNTDPEYENLISYLLKDIYCVDDADEAKRLLEEAISDKPCVKFITKQGDVISGVNRAGGSYIGDEELSLIGRDAKIERLKQKYNQTKDNISELDSELEDKNRNSAEFGEQMESLEKTIHKQDINNANIQSDINAVNEEINKFNNEIDLLDTEIRESQAEKNGLLEKQKQYESKLEEVRTQNSEVQSVIISSQQSAEQKSEQAQNITIEITEIKTELSSIDKLYSNKKDAYDILNSRIEETAQGITDNETELENSKERINYLDKEISKLLLSDEDLEKEKENVIEKINNVNTERESMLNKLKQSESSLRTKQSDLADTRQSLHGFQIRNTEYSLKVDNIKDRMRDNYKVNLDEVDVEIKDDINWRKIEKDTAKLKKQLDSMGNVNLVAIDEHQELKERYDFLTNQRQDLEEAKDSLNQAIKKIDITTTKMFKETFQEIREKFKEFFRMLFGGGKAELKLLDEKNVLESGIEITARPPGKKLQNISLLSGGEKALCAVALLFAVFKVKPSPFCVLDEIDAPLDEANVDRFTKVLRDFVKTSQFIIITHNKKTIGMADVMYGVTMEESGVSKLVSVKFVEDAQETEEQPAGVNS